MNSYRLFEFKKLYGGTPPALGELRRLIQDDAAWCGGPCYPLAWAVVRYLHDEQRPALAALLQQLMSSDGLPRDPTERAAALEKSLGPLDERWAERLYTRTMALPLDPSAFGE